MQSQQVQQATTGSFPLFSVLGVLFIFLKLTHQIDWSWWWVLAPFWLPLAAVLAFMAVMILFALVMTLVGALFK